MTFADTTVRTQTDAITFELDLPHAPEKVWRALTDPTLMAQWLLPATGLKLQPGAAFTLKTPQAFADWDGTVDCRFVAIETHRKLSYTWNAPFLETVVTFTLAPTPSGTRLTIVQSGFKPEQKQNFGGARYGWKLMGGKLIDLLAKI